ncbi:transaldolase [Halorhodospira halochloris]|uniref:Transaldolase n=1 Tax=Halorhodospira halochloris TaxID=1052 RepID=A0A0X8X6V8_HALHR|nr:transaldolase [Halorhodospira halochloris]MBK1650803.1 transaldolase [Halorhodospira halochloris]MCG5547156.1 transaldolase [Halorhodospira halochloris]BAU56699.1 transaldolase [Halorhodospira halochloris]
MNDNPLLGLHGIGQSVWFDNIHRGMLPDELQNMCQRDGLSGITSNPAIFQKAIGSGNDYDEAIAELIAQGESDPERIYEHLATSDIRDAADVLHSVYKHSGGADGFVSIEVSPRLADDVSGTLEEAKRLLELIDRPNVMIKVPATEAGVAAIEELTASGVSVNATLLFSTARYRQVAQAYIKGLQRRIDSGSPIDGIASVASLFISRIDAKVDPQLEQHGADYNELQGQAAIANARCAYSIFRELFHSTEFAALRQHSANPQRLLWASTGVKGDKYPATYYIENLAGPETVTTIPPATYEAYRCSGDPAPRLLEGIDAAPQIIGSIRTAGVELDAILAELEQQGVDAFVEAYDALLQDLSNKLKTFQ